ncbi:MAG: hypothetical protein GWN11_08030 [Candidatus Dadabacteria bacterium]|nr:hypothetical protein [Candidatus Dadabacteria bacterium]
MANYKHLEILGQGAEKWNKWRQENPEITPDFGWANMPAMDLRGYDFENANLKLAFCKSCIFTGANLKNSNLYGANLEDTNCSNADFSGANLEGALIKDASLKGSKLKDCNWRLANLEGSDFEAADLSGSKKLKTDQLSKVTTLYKAKVSERLLEKLIQTNPDLFNKSADI